MNKKKKLKKLSKFDILSLVIGSIIGWGSFSLPGSKFLDQSGVINTTIGFIIGGLFVLFIQKGYHTMMIHHGEDGGEFSYTYNNLGRKHGFVVGWSLILCYLSMIPLNATAFLLVLKQIFGESISIGYLYTVAGHGVYISDIVIASSIILLFAYINKQGLKMSSIIQNTLVLMLVVNVFFLFSYMSFKGNTVQFRQNYISNYVFSMSQIAKIVAIVPFLFVGFDVVPQVTTDLGFKPRKATLLTVIAIFLGVSIYSLLNAITGLAYSPSQALKKDWATGQAVFQYVGIIGFVLLIIALIAAVVGGINGFMISSSKIVGALSDYKLFPKKYSLRNEKGAHSNAITFVTIVSLVAPWLGREVIIYIVDMSSVLAAIAYGYVCFISYNYSKKIYDKTLELIGLLVSILFIALLILPGSPSQLSIPSFILLGIWIGVGFIYYLSANYKIKKEINQDIAQ